VYGLINNYRSLPETIDGYNAILKKDGDGPDWFAFDQTAASGEIISYPSGGDAGGLARAPDKRPGTRGHALPAEPVHVMVLEGNAPKRRRDMAESARMVIRSLKGHTISVPRGTAWADITLDFRDFAVIVETHDLADYFLEEFQAHGIPAVKYKMQGVFQSPLAGDIHALLRAVLHPAGDPSPRLSALLTRFFNRHPREIDPEKDLEPCRNQFGQCKQGGACISHALEEWTLYASNHLWARLFKSIGERTAIRERLIRLVDGRRHLADLKQVSDYCMEKLYRGNYSLQQLVEHLGRLLAGEESAGQDKNLFTLSTDASSVKVLTMHSAKGLEFPVVFVATAGSKEPRTGPDALSWIGSDHKTHIVPYLKTEETRIPVAGRDTPCTMMLAQANQERRRLLYVALTRAQAMLFVPAHADAVAAEGPASWQIRCQPPKRSPDLELTPRLLQLLDRNEIELFDRRRWTGGLTQETDEPDDHLDPAWTMPPAAAKASREMEERIFSLNLAGRICRQTSYTELSSEAAFDRLLDHGEEGNDSRETGKKPRPALPGGAQTGDALHLAIEEILGAGDSRALITGSSSSAAIVETYLDRNRVLKDLGGDRDRSRAIASGAEFVNGALTASLPLPREGTVVIVDLKKSDRRAEMEFFLGVAPHWVHGFMDLVFRLENSRAKHPWRYYVLDWKSDQLDAFDEQRVNACMQERHYDLQSKLYCHALDKYLGGILGEAYDPKQNLGGAVYVFLRSFSGAPQDAPEDACHAWTRSADPERDAKFTLDQIDALVRRSPVRA
jgi:exodeoxyribonuclease V beta subunit